MEGIQQEKGKEERYRLLELSKDEIRKIFDEIRKEFEPLKKAKNRPIPGAKKLVMKFKEGKLAFENGEFRILD